MPVTELSLIASSVPGEVPPALRELGQAGIVLQGEWCAANAPWLTQDRGAALFQQVEDPGIMAITAHWDSLQQHHTCIASPANQRAVADWVPHINVEAMKPGHIDGLHLFPASEDDDEGLIPALTAPILAVITWDVPQKDKLLFEEAMDKVKGLWDAATIPYRHRGGWKIEKDRDIEQFVVVGGLDSLEKSKELSNGEAWNEYSRVVSPFILRVETKHYKRIA
ncbi:hypothetical protein F4677DRAFT_75931 [Hypoxylon crocopeplum]|nr:hypothetical protein F4677DRAFT_75931 [Hypoxylon crocopeplum]